MLLITINEIIEEYGYNCKQISDMTGIGYNHILGLKNFKHKYTKNDIKKINDWFNRRDNNIVYIEFKPKENAKIYDFQKRGVINFDEYRRKKIQEQRRLERKNRELQRAENIRKMFRN